jgi:GT2 family glycosyltransferase
MNIAVLLTCFNRKEKTLSCLKSLFAATLPSSYKFEVFLVDDCSTDGTSVAIKEMYPHVHIIQGTGDLFWNRGMVRAWLTASEHSFYDFYLLLNDDVILYPSFFECILNDSSSSLGSIICGSVQSAVDNKITYGGMYHGQHKIEPNGFLQRCKVFNGNVVLIPDNVFKKLGTLDPTFVHAIGDYDYALRAYRSGIFSFVASEYVGTCENHTQLPIWCLPETKFLKRIKSLYSPLGNAHPYYYFIFEYRHYGLLKATLHFFSIHLRAMFPLLWNSDALSKRGGL